MKAHNTLAAAVHSISHSNGCEAQVLTIKTSAVSSCSYRPEGLLVIPEIGFDPTHVEVIGNSISDANAGAHS